MKQENKEFLDFNRPHHDTVVKAGFLKNLDAGTRTKMVEIIREEFQPGYATDLWCAPCVFDMVKLVYRYYDEYLDRQAKIASAAAESNNDSRNSSNSENSSSDSNNSTEQEELEKSEEKEEKESEPAPAKQVVQASFPLQQPGTSPSNKKNGRR